MRSGGCDDDLIGLPRRRCRIAAPAAMQFALRGFVRADATASRIGDTDGAFPPLGPRACHGRTKPFSARGWNARFLDPDVLDGAAEQGRVVFTRDSDFLAEGIRRQRAGLPFATIGYAHQQYVSIGRCVDDLSMVAVASAPDEAIGQIDYLPL